MPRPPRAASAQLTPGQANYVLQRLIRDRRVSASDIQRYVGDMHTEIRELEQRLSALRDAAQAAPAAAAAPAARRRGRPARAAAAAPAAKESGAQASAPSKKGGRRRRRAAAELTPEQQASRQLQGKYLALVRQIPKSKRAYFGNVAREKGRDVAIKEMTAAIKK